jgi:hypothetical protein
MQEPITKTSRELPWPIELGLTMLLFLVLLIVI